MRVCLAKAAIIGLCLLALGGCSMLRVAYDQGPTLAWWWLDGYVDFSVDQTPQAKQAVQQWFAWHRRTQLPDYAGLLAAAQVDVMQPSTPQQVCRWAQRLRERVDPALQHAVLLAAPLATGLTPAQLDHLQRKFRKSNQDFREDFLQSDAGERFEASVKRASDRAEMLYGALDADQRRLLADGIATSPFNPQAWLDERVALQQETLRTLRRLSAQDDPRAAEPALRALAMRALNPPPSYSAYQQRLSDYNCRLSSRLHNSTTVAQRAFARQRLRAWEEDLRALASAADPR